MKKYRIRPVNLHDGNHLCEKAEPPCETVVTLADAEQYAEEAVKRDTELLGDCLRELQMCDTASTTYYEVMVELQNRLGIRSRGAGPVPKLEKLNPEAMGRNDTLMLANVLNAIIDYLLQERK